MSDPIDIPRLSDADIQQLAIDMAANTVLLRIVPYTDLVELRRIFMILALVEGDQFPLEAGAVYEYVSASSMAVNGLPAFMSCKTLNHADVPLVIGRWEEISPNIDEGERFDADQWAADWDIWSTKVAELRAEQARNVELKAELAEGQR